MCRNMLVGRTPRDLAVWVTAHEWCGDHHCDQLAQQLWVAPLSWTTFTKLKGFGDQIPRTISVLLQMPTDSAVSQKTKRRRTRRRTHIAAGQRGQLGQRSSC